MTRGVELVADTRDEIGESPVWCSRSRSIVWTDIAGRRLHRLETGTGRLSTVGTSMAVGCLALTETGGFVAATEDGFATLALSERAADLTPIATVLRHQPLLRFNDGRCDRRGRFVASSMAWAPQADHAPGGLWSLSSQVKLLDAGPLIIPNGLAFSPDGDRLYLSDSHPTRSVIWTFDYDQDEQTLGGRRTFLEMRATGARPDGAAVDTDGCYWIAATDAGQVRRYTPDGALDCTIGLPVPHPTMPVFGGDDLRTLFIASARRPGTPPSAPDGGLFAVRTDQQGIAETPWRPNSQADAAQCHDNNAIERRSDDGHPLPYAASQETREILPAEDC